MVDTYATPRKISVPCQRDHRLNRIIKPWGPRVTRGMTASKSGMTRCRHVATVFCGEGGRGGFLKGTRSAQIWLLWMFPGQNLEQTWNSGTDQVHKNDHNMALQLLRPSIPAYQ